MRAIFRAGLLHPVRELDEGDARRTGVGVMRPEPVRQRPLEGRILEMQSTAGNAAVERFLQADDETGEAGARPATVQREAGAGSGDASGTGSDVTSEGRPADGVPDGDGVLRFGDEGEEVRRLQIRLNRVVGGRRKLQVDGTFGRRTQAAVRRFQAARPPLRVDGDAGPDTLRELDRASPWTAEDVDIAAVERLFRAGQELYMAGSYGAAYDEFSKAWEITNDLTLLWNRAQALRLLGGRREEAIRLYEQFLASNADADEQRSQARTYIEELRGPGRSGDKSLDTAMESSFHRMGVDEFRAERYAQAYDEFTKAHEINDDPALLWNRAQSLRLAGGRRAEAIALYERFVAEMRHGAEEARRNALDHIARLKGPGRQADAAVNAKAAREAFETGKALYETGDYAKAYDEFTKAWEIDPDPAYLFNRAQALRTLGGRRDDALALYREFLTHELPDNARADAQARITELSGPGRTAPRDAPAR